MRTKLLILIILIPIISYIAFVETDNYFNGGLSESSQRNYKFNITFDDTPYDVEISFDREEYAVNYVVNGNTDYLEIDIPFDRINGVFMIYVNDQVVDDERVILDGNKIIVNYGQNIESVKVMGSHDLGVAEP